MRHWFIILIGLLVLAHSTESYKKKVSIHYSPSNHAKSKTKHQVLVELDESKTSDDLILSSIESEHIRKHKKKSNRDRHIAEKTRTKNKFSKNRHLRNDSLHHESIEATSPELTTESLRNTEELEKTVEDVEPEDIKIENDKDGFEYYDKITNHNDKNRTNLASDTENEKDTKISNSKEKKSVDSELEDMPKSAEGVYLVGPNSAKTSTTQAPLSSYDWGIWCKLQPNSYDCDASGLISTNYFYDLRLDDCREYSFGSCIDNVNKFKFRRDCLLTCEEAAYQDLPPGFIERNVACRMQPDFGACNDYFPMFYFDVSERVCKGFSYSGCGGNANKFRSAFDCIENCARILKYEPKDYAPKSKNHSSKP